MRNYYIAHSGELYDMDDPLALARRIEAAERVVSALVKASELHKPSATWGSMHFTEPIGTESDFTLIADADITRLKAARADALAYLQSCLPDTQTGRSET